MHINENRRLNVKEVTVFYRLDIGLCFTSTGTDLYFWHNRKAEYHALKKSANFLLPVRAKHSCYALKLKAESFIAS